MCQGGLLKRESKLYEFARIRPFLNNEKAKLLLTSVVMSSTLYCPQIRMFCSKPANKDINRKNKRALGVLYEDYESSLEHIFVRDGSITTHQQELTLLMTESYKTIKKNKSFIYLECF